MTKDTIECRAQLSENCKHGQDGAADEEEKGTDSWRDDGTYDGKTVVCDPCYISIMPLTRSGQAATDEIPAAVDTLRHALLYLKAHDNPSELRDHAQRQQKSASPGTPYHRSSGFMAALADREVRRRAGETDLPPLESLEKVASEHSGANEGIRATLADLGEAM